MRWPQTSMTHRFLIINSRCALILPPHRRILYTYFITIQRCYYITIYARVRRGVKRVSLDVDGRRKEYLALLPSYAATDSSSGLSPIRCSQCSAMIMPPRSQDRTTSSADDTPSAMVVLPIIAFKIQSPISKSDRFGLLGPIDDLQQPR